MTREEAKELCLKLLEEDMEKNNKSLDDVFLMSPRRGKDSWTYGEYKEAVINDKPLDGLDTEKTPIDDMLNYQRYLKEHME